MKGCSGGWVKIVKENPYMSHYYLVIYGYAKRKKLVCGTFKWNRIIPKCRKLCEGKIGYRCEVKGNLKPIPDILGMIKVGE